MAAPRAADSGTPHPGLGFRGFVVLVASLMAINALSIDSMLPALATIGDAIGIPHANDRQWIITAYMLGFGAAQIVYGTLADRFGRKPVLLSGLVLYVITTLLAALASTFAMMMVARAIQGVAAAATRVLAVSIVRDCYSGRTMARVMSLTMIVFLAAPIIAPSLGQLILLVAPWRWIFFALALFALILIVVTWRRLPETLRPEDRLPIQPSAIWRATREVLTNRVAIGYTFASATMFGGMIGFITSAQQIFTDIFDVATLFPLIFAACAGTMALASFVNARLVERLGTRRLSHTALLVYVGIALVHVAVALLGFETLWTFSILQALMMGCLGLAGSNFGAMAMEPVGHIAGTASSVQGTISTMGGALIGTLVGQSYDGTTLPLSYGYLAFGLLAVFVVLWVEGGRLFRPAMAPVAAQ